MKLLTVAIGAAIIFFARPLYAQDDSQASASARTVDLEALVQQVAAAEDLQFLLDGRARSVFVGGTPIENPGYTDLLSRLRLNGWSAIEVAGRINIVPTAEIRSYALPLVQRDDPSIPDDAWVTRVITVRGENPEDGPSVAAGLIPVLRPLLPQSAHFASNGADKIFVVDRYANVRRITELVRELTE